MSVHEILTTAVETVSLNELDDLGDVSELMSCGFGCGGSKGQIN